MKSLFQSGAHSSRTLQMSKSTCTYPIKIGQMVPRYITYSSSYTMVPTYECFNSCTYCNFRINVLPDESAMMSLEKSELILQRLRNKSMHEEFKVDEILILSGEIHPKSARRQSWFRRIVDLCELSLKYNFLPHTNCGPLSREEMSVLGEVNASMGLMLEQSTPSLMSGVHRFAPSKAPSIRLQQLELAGQLRIPFTTGILLGVGETEEDRRTSLQDIANIAYKYNHIQEVILQPYSPADDKYATRDGGKGFQMNMMLQTVRMAREILPENVAIQVPPNLLLAKARVSSCSNSKSSTDRGSAETSNSATEYDCDSDSESNILHECLLAGVSDLGGISPLDEVNPNYDFPPVEALRRKVEIESPSLSSKYKFKLIKRLPVHERLISMAAEKRAIREVLAQTDVLDRL